jgi:phosphonatase-like hydrolase
VDGGDQVNGGRAATLVCCGLIGTTVNDKGVVERAYAEACATQGIVPGTAPYARFMVIVHQSRGEPPVEVFRRLFPGGDGRAEAATLSFERSLRAAVDRTGLAPAPGAETAIQELGEAGVRVCLITGLSRSLLGLVLDTLGWWRRADLFLCPEDVPRGCPSPDLMLAAMLRLGVDDVRDAVFAGNTASGVTCGKRSGAGMVVGVLNGGHTRDRLRAAGATHFAEGIGDLARIVAGGGDTRPVPPAASAPQPRVPLERRRAGL